MRGNQMLKIYQYFIEISLRKSDFGVFCSFVSLLTDTAQITFHRIPVIRTGMRSVSYTMLNRSTCLDKLMLSTKVGLI